MPGDTDDLTGGGAPVSMGYAPAMSRWCGIDRAVVRPDDCSMRIDVPGCRGCLLDDDTAACTMRGRIYGDAGEIDLAFEFDGDTWRRNALGPQGPFVPHVLNGVLGGFCGHRGFPSVV